MSWRSFFAGWRRRSWGERWLVLEAVGWLGLMSISIHLLRFERITRWLGLQADHRSSSTLPTHPQVAQILWAIQTAVAYLPWPNLCLVQGLSAAVMLKRRNIPLILWLGVRKEPHGMEAHAWVTSGEVIVTGAAGRERFHVVGQFGYG